MLSVFCIVLALAAALRFEILAGSGRGTTRCFEQMITEGVHVQGTIDVPNKAYQTVDFLITDGLAFNNKHYSKSNVMGPQKFSFTTQLAATYKFCFTNTLHEGHQPSPETKREVFLNILSGPGETAKSEKANRFADMEADAKWLVSVGQEAYSELRNFDNLEKEMYKINESTRDRVFNFSSFSLVLLIALGVWEIYYLYQFFKSKHLI